MRRRNGKESWGKRRTYDSKRERQKDCYEHKAKNRRCKDKKQMACQCSIRKAVQHQSKNCNRNEQWMQYGKNCLVQMSTKNVAVELIIIAAKQWGLRIRCRQRPGMIERRQVWQNPLPLKSVRFQRSMTLRKHNTQYKRRWISHNWIPHSVNE